MAIEAGAPILTEARRLVHLVRVRVNTTYAELRTRRLCLGSGTNEDEEKESEKREKKMDRKRRKEKKRKEKKSRELVVYVCLHAVIQVLRFRARAVIGSVKLSPWLAVAESGPLEFGGKGELSVLTLYFQARVGKLVFV